MGQVLSKHTEKKIVERLRMLPPQQLEEVMQFIDFIAQRRQESDTAATLDDVKRPILALRGRGKGEHLVEKLLRSRREDQRYDER